jgi:hypothetical protein
MKAPPIKTCTAPQRFNMYGVIKAPTKYPTALNVFMLPAKV